MISYKAPFLLFNAHVETIYPSLFRKLEVPYRRERIATHDNDFLDLDWLEQQSTRLVIISHGLEGNSKRPYVTGMARHFYNDGFDVLAWNYRGCSEEMNHQLRFYHSGATDDLDAVVQHAAGNNYDEIFLVGFSLGGNLTLKFLGESHPSARSIRKAVVFSVPLELHSSCMKISSPSNWIYSRRFLQSLKDKVTRKALKFPSLDTQRLPAINSLMEFDDLYTAPLHGFKSAEDYYQKSSALHFLPGIEVPALIVNAANDPFLSAECYPSGGRIDNTRVQFESPARGGHCGFSQFGQNGVYWSEQRALAFIRQS